MRVQTAHFQAHAIGNSVADTCFVMPPVLFDVCSLNAFVVVFARGLDLAPGGRKKREEQVTLRELHKRVSGNAQDYEEVMRKAKRQSSTTGAVPVSQPSSTPGSKRASTHCPTVPSTPGTVPPTPGAPGRGCWHAPASLQWLHCNSCNAPGAQGLC